MSTKKSTTKEKEKEKEKRTEDSRRRSGDFELVLDSTPNSSSSSHTDPNETILSLLTDITKRLASVESSVDKKAKKTKKKEPKVSPKKKNALSKSEVLPGSSDSDQDEDEDEDFDEEERRRRRIADIQSNISASNSSLPDIRFDKARSQHEYEFLQLLMAVMDDPVFSPDEKYMMVVETVEARAAILITAQEDGWGVAAELELFDNPKKAFLRRFRKDIDGARKRHSAKAKTKVVYVSSSAVKDTGTKGLGGSKGSFGASSFGSTGVAVKKNTPNDRRCFICDSKDHFANRCPSKGKGNTSGATQRDSSVGSSSNK